MPSSPSVLVLILDCNTPFWRRRQKASASSSSSSSSSTSSTSAGGGAGAQPLVVPPTFPEILESVLVFINSFLLRHRQNRIAVIAANHARGNVVVYPPDAAGADATGVSTTFARVDRSILAGFERLKAPVPAPGDDDAVAGASSSSSSSLSSSSPPIGGGDGSLAGALSLALCYLNRVRKTSPRHKARILCLHASADDPSQYVASMNAIFCAQKLGAAVDACVLSDAQSGLLQQAAHMTGGIYHRVRPARQPGLLQYLVTLYLPDQALRKHLVLPAPSSVDFRAMCFETQKFVDVAYVCSVCLSIFSEFKTRCPTCDCPTTGAAGGSDTSVPAITVRATQKEAKKKKGAAAAADPMAKRQKTR